MMRLLTLSRYLRFKPFDESTEEGVRSERYRRALWTMLANVFGRGASMLVMVLAVSLTIPYLGVERFGAWMTVVSLAGLLIFLDLGIGNALTNRVAKINAEGGRVCDVISGGLIFLLLVSVIVLIVLSLIATILPWDKLIKTDDSSLWEEFRDAGLSFAVIFSISLFFGGVHRVFAGLQRAYESHLASVVSAGMSLILLFVGAKYECGIVFLLWATLGCQQISGVFLLLRLWWQDLFGFKNGLFFMRVEKDNLIQVGGLFLVLQLASIVYVGMDALLISSVLGAAHVAIYAVVQRLFQFVSIPLSIINAPLWAAYADAYTRRDGFFIVHTFRRSLFLTALIGLFGGGVLWVFSQDVIGFWTGGGLSVPLSLVGAFFVVMVVESLGHALAMVLNGCGFIREQVFFAMVMIFFGVTFKVLGFFLYGIEGMLWVWALVYSLCAVSLYGVLWRQKIARAMSCSVESRNDMQSS